MMFHPAGAQGERIICADYVGMEVSVNVNAVF